jgi:integrase
MAHVRKLAPKRWQARYRGPDRREHAHNFTRELDAKRFASSVENDRARGQWLDPRLAKTRFGEYAAGWLETVSHVRPGTRLNIEGRLRNHVLPFFDDIPLGAIKPNHVRAWLSEMVVKGLAPATISATYRTLANVLKTAELDGYIARTPCVGIGLRKETHHEEMHFLTPEEVARLAEAITPRFRAHLHGGLYGAEMGRAGRSQGRAAQPAPGYGRRCRGRRRGQRLPSLRSTQDRRPAHRLPPPLPLRPVGRAPRQIFQRGRFGLHGARGGRSAAQQFSRRHFKPAKVSSQLATGLRFHDLRHTCAALLIAQGAHPKEIQDHLGHSTIRLTFDRYGHLFPNLGQRLTEGLEASYRGSLADSTRTEAPNTATVTALPDVQNPL